MHIRLVSVFIALVLIVSAPMAALAQAFETKAKQVYLIDAETGTVLFARDENAIVPHGVSGQVDDDGSRLRCDRQERTDARYRFSRFRACLANRGRAIGPHRRCLQR